MGFFIPETMKKYNNWLVWCKEGEGHFRKMPYDPRTGRRADPTAPCCDYDTAQAFFEYGGEYDGIGFTFTEDNPFTFIDLDHCCDEAGELTPFAQEVADMFADCYAEMSQSEEGLHIICIGSVPRAVKRDEIEIYSCKRYCAMTGNAINHNEPQEAQERLTRLFNTYKTKEAPNEPQTSAEDRLYRRVSANGIIEVIKHSRQGEKFMRLHEGNLQGYESPSNAVQAYIDILNHFTAGDEEIITEVLKQGYFATTKHAGADYIARSIRKAQRTATQPRSTSALTRARRVRTNEAEEAAPKKGRRRIGKQCS